MNTNISKNKNLQLFISNIARDVFEVFTLFYLALLLINQVKLGFVSDFINLNHILIIVVISGLISIWKKEIKVTNRDYLFITCLAFIGAITIFYKTSVFSGFQAFALATLSFVFIILVLFFLLKK